MFSDTPILLSDITNPIISKVHGSAVGPAISISTIPTSTPLTLSPTIIPTTPSTPASASVAEIIGWDIRVVNEIKKFEAADEKSGNKLKAILNTEILAGLLPSSSQYHIVNIASIRVTDNSSVMIDTSTSSFNNIMIIMVENSALKYITITGSTKYVLLFGYTDVDIVMFDPAKFAKISKIESFDSVEHDLDYLDGTLGKPHPHLTGPETQVKTIFD